MDLPEWSHFTSRVKETLWRAREEALRLHQNVVDTEHVLLGLIRLGQGVAVNVLVRLGLNLENVRAELEKLIVNTPDEKVFGNARYTPRMRRVILMAKDEARALHHIYIGTEHILLALLREKEGLVADIFRKFQLDFKQVQDGILKLKLLRSMKSIDPLDETVDISSFTPRTKETLWLAREEALRLHDNYIGTEHMLLGIIRLGQGAAAKVLVRLGLNLESVWTEVEKQIGIPPEERKPSDYAHNLKAKLKQFVAHIQMGAVWPLLAEPLDKWLTYTRFTPRTKLVLQFAIEEAAALNHAWVGTEHLLLGLMRENDGIAAHVLGDFTVSIKRVRSGILKEMDPTIEDG